MAAKVYTKTTTIDTANAVKIGIYGHVLQERPVPAWCWPGGYTMYYVGDTTNDVYCSNCVNEMLTETDEDVQYFYEDRTFTCDTHEEGEIFYCCNCNAALVPNVILDEDGNEVEYDA